MLILRALNAFNPSPKSWDNTARALQAAAQPSASSLWSIHVQNQMPLRWCELWSQPPSCYVHLPCGEVRKSDWPSSIWAITVSCCLRAPCMTSVIHSSAIVPSSTEGTWNVVANAWAELLNDLRSKDAPVPKTCIIDGFYIHGENLSRSGCAVCRCRANWENKLQSRGRGESSWRIWDFRDVEDLQFLVPSKWDGHGSGEMASNRSFCTLAWLEKHDGWMDPDDLMLASTWNPA